MIEKREYVEEIERIAREALEAEREYGQDVYDAAWESVDGHRWVIYSAYARIIPSLTSSDGSNYLYDCDLNETYQKEGLGGLLSLVAFACMMEDVQERIAALRAEEEEEE